ncbi:MAG: fibronectin type III-like domain-contianing protein [Janthinobacterium lividum]
MLRQAVPDVRRPCCFDKVALRPGETKTFPFTLPVAGRAYSGPTGEPVPEAGDFDLKIGDQKQLLARQ